jgi:hypothetical protein
VRELAGFRNFPTHIVTVVGSPTVRTVIRILREVWHEVEDMTEALRKMQEEGSHTEESGEAEGS